MMNEQTFVEHVDDDYSEFDDIIEEQILSASTLRSSSYLTIEEEKRKKNDIKFEESNEDHLLSQNTTESSIPANVQNSNTKKEDKM